MITIKLKNATSKVIGATPEIKQLIWDTCSYDISKNMKYMPKYNDNWETRKSVYDKRTNLFPTGLIPQLHRALTLNNVPIHYDDIRDKTAIKGKEVTTSITLRDYQQEAVDIAIKKQRGVLVLPVGAGKTVIAIALVAKLGVPSLFLTNSSDMLTQLKSEIERFTGMEVSTYGAGKKDIGFYTVATFQALGALMKRNPMTGLQEFSDYFKAMIIDEYHHSTASTYLNSLLKMEGILFRYGLTATLSREDDSERILASLTGDIIYTIKKDILVKKGFLVPATIKFIPMMQNMGGDASDYHDLYDRNIVDNAVRNIEICEQAQTLIKEGRKVLILVTKVRHGEAIAKALGLQFISGKTGKKIREKAKEDLKTGNIQALVTSSIFDEGIDIPFVSGVVLAGGGKSKAKTIQRVGRALRPKQGKKDAIIIDFMDSGNGITYRHSMQRMTVYKQEEWDVEISAKSMFR